jgi:DNA replication protein DnaC
MNPMPQLEPLVKQLRLSGILDSLEARNRQAIEAKLAYTDFLALLVQDEVARRDQRQFAQRLRKAQVVGDKTFERFDSASSPSVNHALLAELATCRFVTEQAPVLIAGPTGTGKSHLVQALCHCALRAGYEVLFITHAKLLAQLYAARATNGFSANCSNWRALMCWQLMTSACVRCARHRTRISTTWSMRATSERRPF